MQRAFVTVAKRVFNQIYRAHFQGSRINEVVFVSRQADEPSFDFQQLAAQFRQRGWKTTMLLKKVTKRNILTYTSHVLRELKLLSRCKLVILDRYDPVVSLVNLDCEPHFGGQSRTDLHHEFPSQPVVIQIWHAFGAFKKFGFQSIDTPEGHSSETTSVFNIHRNYSWIVCSGEGCRTAFAEAFNYPIERVVVLDRPEYSELLELHKELDGTFTNTPQPDSKHPFKVLMAPTLRKSKTSAHPFHALYENAEVFKETLGSLAGETPIEFIWSFHPLEEGHSAPGNASAQLIDADCVVTDYSSIVYEAYLLGKPVLFYVPDLKSYLLSPGLNANPGEICPDTCAWDEEELARLIAVCALDPSSYPSSQFAAFAAPVFEHSHADSTYNIVDFALSCVEEQAQ